MCLLAIALFLVYGLESADRLLTQSVGCVNSIRVVDHRSHPVPSCYSYTPSIIPASLAPVMLLLRWLVYRRAYCLSVLYYHYYSLNYRYRTSSQFTAKCVTLWSTDEMRMMTAQIGRCARSMEMACMHDQIAFILVVVVFWRDLSKLNWSNRSIIICAVKVANLCVCNFWKEKKPDFNMSIQFDKGTLWKLACFVSP